MRTIDDLAKMTNTPIEKLIAVAAKYFNIPAEDVGFWDIVESNNIKID